MPSSEDLRRTLHRIDGRGYKAYKDIEGTYGFDGFDLMVDHVQGDPFADPSRIRVSVPQDRAAFPNSTFEGRSRRIALEDYLARCFDRALRRAPREASGAGSSGSVFIDAPGQEILERSAVCVDETTVEARFKAGLPARGRTIMGRAAARMLVEMLPKIVSTSLVYKNLDDRELKRHVESAEDQETIRGALRERGLVAFVADGSVLPRRSGVDDRPLEEKAAVRFESPRSLSVSFDAPNAGTLTGMGVPEGVTLIVGGGFHGKSTLLRALELGVYSHVPGDGRERVVGRDDAVKIRAEDGRSVERVDISPFIGDLPYGRSTVEFSTENASGSTSQAANIMESLESGSKLLLIDEDTSATNFMIRDARMQRLVAADKEPIRPLVDLARVMYGELGVSTVIVMGGSGDYLDVADTVIMMDSYRPKDVTTEARRVASDLPSKREESSGVWPQTRKGRSFDPRSMDASRGRREKVSAKGIGTILFGRRTIDISAVEQIVDQGQTRAIGDALIYLRDNCLGREGKALPGALEELDRLLDKSGLDAIMRAKFGDRARPRRYEVAAALCRLRGIAARA
jgi:predicted ABC-class ATPase